MQLHSNRLKQFGVWDWGVDDERPHSRCARITSLTIYCAGFDSRLSTHTYTLSLFHLIVFRFSILIVCCHARSLCVCQRVFVWRQLSAVVVDDVTLPQAHFSRFGVVKQRDDKQKIRTEIMAENYTQKKQTQKKEEPENNIYGSRYIPNVSFVIVSLIHFFFSFFFFWFFAILLHFSPTSSCIWKTRTFI